MEEVRGLNLSPDPPCWVGVLLELLVELLEELEVLDPPLGTPPPGRDAKRSTLSHSTLGSAALMALRWAAWLPGGVLPWL